MQLSSGWNYLRIVGLCVELCVILTINKKKWQISELRDNSLLIELGFLDNWNNIQIVHLCQRLCTDCYREGKNLDWKLIT